MDAREYYRDPALRVAADLMRGGDQGMPSHTTVEAAHARRTLRQVAAPQRSPRGTGVKVTTQTRQALAGRTVQPLPTRTARAARRARRRMTHRLGLAALVALPVLVALLFFLPAAAAVGMGLAAGTAVLANVK